jgi:Major Facilitator Superfamily
MTDATSERTRYSDALASGEFRALLATQLIVVGGLSVAAVALTVLVYRRTASPLLASLTFALGFLPFLLGGGLMSSVVDVVRPRRLVATCDATSALIVAAVAWPGLPLELLFVLLLANGTLSSMSSGARAALTRATVPDRAYVPARSLLRIAAQLAQILGNAGGGALLLLVGPPGALLINSAAYGCSAVTIRLALSDYPNAGGRSDRTLVRDSLHGARVILGHRALRQLLLVGWLGPMFSVAPEALAAPYVAAHHDSASIVGVWLVALPVGLIVGDIAGVRLLTSSQQKRIVVMAASAGFVPYLAFAANPAIGVALALLFASGTCGVYSLGLDARVRDAAPPQLFARVMTLNQSGLMALQGIGFVLAGALGQAIGPPQAIAAAGLCGLTVTVALLRDDLRGLLPPAVRADNP